MRQRAQAPGTIGRGPACQPSHAEVEISSTLLLAFQSRPDADGERVTDLGAGAAVQLLNGGSPSR